MDFFDAQARAHQQSRLLGWAFALTLLLVILSLNIVVLTVLRVCAAFGSKVDLPGDSLTEWSMAHPGTVLGISLLVGGFIGVASLTRMLQLREGGGYVARAVGGVRVERGTPDPRRRMLSNIVDEMALASGIPAPEIYVLEQEESINAFAAGHTPANAAVAVTRGALTKLNRDQLQGVIAHEFSHVLNGDIRISIRLMGLVFGLMAVALAGRTLIRLAGNGDRRGGVVPVLLLGMVIATIGQIGFWGGRLLQAWISRQRECLADASAVQFTRNPDGLRDALVRATALSGSGRYANAAMEQVAHMLFVNSQRLLATHPPLLQRLQALDPHINREQLDSMMRRAQAQWRESGAAQVPPALEPRDGAEPVLDGIPRPTPRGVSADPDRIAASTGLPGPRHLAFAVALRKALPESLRVTAAAPDQARAQLLALVASEDADVRQNQLDLVAARLGPAEAEAVRAGAVGARRLPPLQRLPAVLQLFASVRALPESERLSLAALLHDMLRCDGRLSVFEYTLEKLSMRALSPGAALSPPHGRLGLEDRAAPLGVVFAVLAGHGARGGEQARRAYEAGIAPLLPRHRPAWNVIDDWVPVFDKALDSLRDLQPLAKQLVIEGLVRTIAHDSWLEPEEAELLRAICGVLECPLPPVLPEAARGSSGG
jgi:Zn-dependent protease with chaperone function